MIEMIYNAMLEYFRYNRADSYASIVIRSYFFLFPLNFGIGVVIPIPKSSGTNPLFIIMLKSLVRIIITDGCA